MKLTLRDLFWLILVAAMAGWWVDHQRLRHEVSRWMAENVKNQVECGDEKFRYELIIGELKEELRVKPER